MLKRLIILSNNDITGRGYLIHRYAEAGSRRLYAQGISLQNTSKLLRRVALNGLYDYDVENCHFSIFYQLADQCNYECEAIKYYLTHKKEIRDTIAKDIGITIEEIKMCLLALMFGAKMNTWKDNSIPQAIGQVKSSALFKHSTFKAIADELSQGKKLILKGSTKRKATLINVMGKPISLKESSNQKLSHIIQGIEAQALKACLTLYPDDIVLLMHDGFVSKKALDVPLIERTIYEATAIQLQLSGSVITLPSELDFSNL